MSEELYPEVIRKFYTEYSNGGKYDTECMAHLITLVRNEKFVEGIHDHLVSQLEQVSVRIDKLSVLFPVSKSCSRRIKSAIEKSYKNIGCEKIGFGDCSGGSDDGIYFKSHIILRWKGIPSSISVFCELKESALTHNVKIAFNFAKHREQALHVLHLIIENIPPSLVGKAIKGARINEFEQYMDFVGIPSFLFFVGKGHLTKKLERYNGGNGSRLLESYYISKGNSRETKVYDKTKEELVRGRRIKSVKFNEIITRLEVTHTRNNMNIKGRHLKFRFSLWKSYTKFTDTLRIYSPLFLLELKETQLRYLLENGFYMFYVEDKSVLHFDIDDYVLEYHKKSKGILNSNTSIAMGQFITDLGKMVEIDIHSLGKEYLSEQYELEKLKKLEGK